MNRRNTIKRLMAASGALVALPAWAESWTALDLEHLRSSFLQEQQTTIAAVADTIIPQGDGVGAISVGVDKFLEKLIDKCYEPEVGENVKKQLSFLETRAAAAHSKNFALCDQKQREALLLQFGGSEDKNQKDFFELVKNETIRGFNTSKEVMTKYLNYKIAPGHYYGCVDVKAS